MSGPTSVAGSSPSPRRSARGPERGPDDPVHRQVEVRVAEDDDGVLPAELEGDPLEATTGPLRDVPARDRRARERDDRYVRRLDDGIAHVGAAARHQVDHA